MKFLTAGLLALAVAASASAQTLVKITGSTAFRKATVASIIRSLNNPVGAFPTGGSLTGAQAVIRGTLKSGPSAGQDVAFQLAWAGSVGGVQTVVQNATTIPGQPAPFLPGSTWLSTTNATSTVTVTITGANNDIYTFGGGTTGATAFDAAATANVAMSDSFQATTPFTSPVLVDVDGSGNGTVGIVPFVWVKGAQSSEVSAASYARLTNISSQAAKELISAGFVNLSLLTGNSADAGVNVVLSGRNNDSGTRLVTFAETAFGQSASPLQYSLTTSGGFITAAALFSPGSNGENSGGTLATKANTIPAVGLRVSGKPIIVVTYLGVSDATSVNGGANCLTYNGVGVSNITSGGVLSVLGSGLGTLIQNGEYTFWGYEHMLYRTTYAGVGADAANAVATQIGTVDALAAGLLNDQGVGMQSARNDENSPVFSLR